MKNSEQSFCHTVDIAKQALAAHIIGVSQIALYPR